MAAKNVKPAAKSTGGPGAAKKKDATTAQQLVDQAGQAAAPQQGTQAPIGSSQSTAAVLTVSTGSQEQPGAPATDSAGAVVLVPPGAAPNCFASSSPKSIPGLAVTSSRDGFWRAGRQWTTAEQRVPLADLTEAQFHQLANDPVLTVEYVDLNPAWSASIITTAPAAEASDVTFELGELDLMRAWYEISMASLGEEDRQLHAKICRILPAFKDRA